MAGRSFGKKLWRNGHCAEIDLTSAGKKGQIKIKRSPKKVDVVHYERCGRRKRKERRKSTQLRWDYRRAHGAAGCTAAVPMPSFFGSRTWAFMDVWSDTAETRFGLRGKNQSNEIEKPLPR